MVQNIQLKLRLHTSVDAYNKRGTYKRSRCTEFSEQLVPVAGGNYHFSDDDKLLTSKEYEFLRVPSNLNAVLQLLAVNALFIASATIYMATLSYLYG